MKMVKKKKTTKDKTKSKIQNKWSTMMKKKKKKAWRMNILFKKLAKRKKKKAWRILNKEVKSCKIMMKKNKLKLLKKLMTKN